MFKLILTFLLTFCLALPTALARDFSDVVILHTNDTHGYLQNDAEHIGVAAIKAIKDDYEKAGKTVFLFDAGDFSNGRNLVSFFKGSAAIDALNATGYDAATIGNHEFDFGQDVLLANIAKANFPIISANIIVNATGSNFAPASTIIEKNGYKLGVIGITTPATITSSNPLYTTGLTFLEGKALYKAVAREVKRLKKQGAELIVVLGHLGLEPAVVPNDSHSVIEQVKGIDIFLDGHDHQVRNEVVEGTLLVSTGSHTKNIGRIVFTNGSWQEELIPYGEYTAEDQAVADIVVAAQAKVDEAYNKVVARSEVDLEGRGDIIRTSETNLGDLVADALLWQTKADCVLTNSGGIRDSLKAGDITLGDINTVLPFQNYLCTVKVKGRTILELIEASTQYTPEKMGGFPQVAGIQFTLDTSVPYEKGELYENSNYYQPKNPGSRVTISSIAGQPFDLDKVYTVGVTDFLLAGGDSYAALRNKENILAYDYLGYQLNEALLNYLEEVEGGVIPARYAKSAGRIIIK